MTRDDSKPPGALLARDGVQEETLELCMVDGARLCVRFSPACGEVRGQVLLLHGRAEFAEKYSHVVAALRWRGLDVVTFDWRGQGRSEAPNGSPRQPFLLYLDDLGQMLKLCTEHHRGGVRIALAHSMGGHLLLRHLATSGSRFDHVWLSAPMLGINSGFIPLGLARRLVRWAADHGLGERRVPATVGYAAHPARLFPNNPLTSDRFHYDRHRALVNAYPELRDPGVNCNWLHDAFESNALLMAPGVLESIDQPITILLGDDERVVCPSAIRAAAARLPRANLLPIAGARHEILMESPAVLRQALADIDRVLVTGVTAAG